MTDRRLVEAFEELATQMPDPPTRSVEELRQRATRRRRRRGVSLAAAVVMLVVVAGAGVAALVGSRSGPPVVDQGPPSASPPPETDEPVTLLLSPQPAPSQGGPLAIMVVNRSEQDFSYEVRGTIDKWNDGQWQRFARFASTLTFWNRTRPIVTGDEPLAAADIGLSAPPRDAGPAEWIRLPPLEPGWYRFSKVAVDGSRPAASAILRVSENAGGPQLTAPGDGPVLDVPWGHAAHPPGAHELRFVLTAPQQNRGEDIAELRESMSSTATIDVWEDSTWRAVTEVAVDKNPPRRGNANEWAVQLPELDAGTYRLAQNSTSDGPIVGHFWITELLEAPSSPGTGPPGDPGTHRGPVQLAGLTARLIDSAVLDIEVPSCNGNPEVEQLLQDEDRVRIQIVSTVSNPGDGCLDAIRIELDQPLDGRQLLDMTSGKPIQVQQSPDG